MSFVNRVGPCHVFLGDPTVVDGGGMTYMGYTRGDVSVAMNIGVSTGRSDQQGRTPLADGVFVTGPTPVVSLPMVDEEKDKLVKVLPGSSLTGSTALGAGSGVTVLDVSSIDTLALVPVDEIDQGTNGIDAPHAIWIPAAISTDFGALMFNLPDGDDAFDPHEVQIAAMLRETDQDANELDQDNGVLFIGPPDQFTNLQNPAPPPDGLWSLPAATP